ncbi:flavodoxin domain-containing protein [Pseudomaricurvus sp. HS19]|uniref:flavodoxin domain-containing protein n=1 Tax=Pseudomaricurvus sp. HS19 TaxID=2692626 RepID=UPI0013705FF9|nr:flavodoxin domain-containing protein [Pseudomaricurvus sp. HS19]MYM64897.1 YbhB and YbcL [Pseudomaricurvus sp. HS19]
MAKVQVIVGSVYGNAKFTAEAVSALLGKLGHEAFANDEAIATDLTRDEDEILLICCSTTGDGEIPRNILPVFSALDNERIDLSGRRYGVIALGDRGYSRFAHAGLLLEDALYRCGARRVGDVLTIDARADANAPLKAALWSKDWIEAFEVCA